MAEITPIPRGKGVDINGYSESAENQLVAHNLMRTATIIGVGAAIGYFIWKNKKIGGTKGAIIGGAGLLALGIMGSRISFWNEPPPISEWLGLSKRERMKQPPKAV